MNWTDYSLVKTLERDADRLGFRIAPSRGMGGGVYLLPKGNYRTLDATLPVYARDAEFGFGTVEGNVAYLAGWDRAIEYMRAMGLVTDASLKKKLVYFNEKYKKQEELREQQKTLDILKK